MLADALRALVLSVWTQVHVGALPTDAAPIADALVQATIARAAEAPALGNHALDLVAMAVWVENESRIRVVPRPESWDAKGAISCGALQEPCAFVRTHSLRDQASYWLQLARYGARVCPDSPLAPLSSGSCQRGRKLAAWRTAKAMALLTAWVNPGEE